MNQTVEERYPNPTETWEVLVGSQTAEEFMNETEYNPVTLGRIDMEVKQYVAELPITFPEAAEEWCEYQEEEWTHIFDMLVQYLRDAFEFQY